MRASFISLVILYLALIDFPALGQSHLIICGGENDLTAILSENGYKFRQIKDPLTAVQDVDKGDGIVFIADGYPDQPLKLPDSVYAIAERRHLRLYVEYPGNLPDISVSDSVIQSKIERGIINTDKMKGLDSLDLLSIHSNFFIPIQCKDPLILLGRVAGLDRAKYGISDVVTYPLLFSNRNIMVATTRFSNCITGRYDPNRSWRKIWSYILRWLDPSREWHFKYWSSEVAPTFKRNEQLPHNAFNESILKGLNWFYSSKLLIDSSWKQLFLQRTSPSGKNVVFPLIDSNYSVGNGTLGILEGNASIIEPDGSQPARWWVRADCQSGTAYALALSADYLNRQKYRITAGNLLNYLYINSNMRSGPRDDPDSPSYGLIGWATTDPDAYYGDDNARVILTTIGASIALNTHKWDRYIVEAIVANFRTAGQLGFRGNWFRDSTIQRLGWERLHQRTIINIHPHYESWLWACYLWLYDKTGYRPFLKESKAAIKITMNKYPDWKWTNGIQQERARMILPLAWLVRIENTPEHREWLRKISNDLQLNLTHDGAIREELGDQNKGKYGLIRSNAEYGLREAPLISQNGDPIADLLYTMNFAFFALNEASHTINNHKYKDATKDISQFLMRIQVKSKRHSELDGAWFRAFNFEHWDYWASNADADWGAWCTETGWIQSWILSTLILEKKQLNFWDYSNNYYHNKSFKNLAIDIINKMLLSPK